MNFDAITESIGLKLQFGVRVSFPSSSLFRLGLALGILCYLQLHTGAQSIVGTYSIADIPTSFGSFNLTCNGPVATLPITLPSGGPWQVTGIDISYDMTATGSGFRSHQRSFIRCENTGMSEDTIYQGSGNSNGVQAYNRDGADIANDYYPGGSVVVFEMRAWRTAIGTTCSTANNKIDNSTWTITLHYIDATSSVEGSVGIGTAAPASGAILELSSEHKAFLPPRLTTAQRNGIPSPEPGMIIFNTNTQNIEFYTVSGWRGLIISEPALKKLLGGTESDIARSIQQTTDGGYIVAGYASSSNTGTLTGLMNNGNNDYWILKLDNNGTIQWQKLLGGSAADELVSLQQTPDGGYIAAGYSSSSNTGTLTGLTTNGNTDYWILKLDNTGTLLWQKLLGGSADDQAFSIQATTDGGYVVAGYSLSSNTGTLTGLTNNGGKDSWVLKLDNSGEIQWQKLLGGSGTDEAFSIKQTTDGGYIVAGYSASSNSGTLTGLTSNGFEDYWIVKLDNNGLIQWQKLIGGGSTDYAYSIDQTLDQGFLVAGLSASSNSGTMTGFINNGVPDYWILRLDAVGTIQWQKLLGGSALDEPLCLKYTTDGGCIVAGYSTSSNTGALTGLTNNGGTDYWILKLDSSGTIQWQKLLGGSLNDLAWSIQETADGGYVIAGASLSSNTGTLTGLTNNGSSDYWILKLDSNGNPK